MSLKMERSVRKEMGVLRPAIWCWNTDILLLYIPRGRTLAFLEVTSLTSSFLLCCFPKGTGCGSGSRGMAAGNEVKTLRRLTQSFSFHLLQVPHGY